MGELPGGPMLTGITTGTGLSAALRFSVLALGCLAVNLGWVSGRASATQCVLKRTGSADISIRNDRVVMVPVTVNGHRATMELNTAVVQSSISSRYAKTLGLSRDHHFQVDGYDSSKRWPWATTPDSFAIGSQSIRKPTFVVFTDDGPPDEDPVPDIGQLGMDLLHIADFELDFANNKLHFYSTDHCPGVVVYWTDHYSSAPITRGFDGDVSFPMELEGKKVLANLSTAIPITRLGTDVTRRLYGFDETSEGVEAETDRPGHAVAYYRAMAVAGIGITVKNAKIELVPVSKDRGRDSPCELVARAVDDVAYYQRCGPPLTVGLNVLRRLHLYFAMREHVLYFSDAAATK
jgi:hypothetical protein